MKFDIVIPTYSRSGSLQHTLTTLADEPLPPEVGRIHVVENGPRAGAEAVCSLLAGQLPIDYHYTAEPGLSNARNIGIAASNADFLLFLDDDIRPLPGALVSYAEAFSRHGTRAFYGGPLIPDYETPPPEWLMQFFPFSVKGFSLGTTEVAVSTPTFLGGNFAAPGQAFAAFGMFEGPSATGRDGGGLGEEMRLQQRMLEEGYPGIFVPGAAVMHRVPSRNCTTRFLTHRYWRSGYGDGELASQRPYEGRIIIGAPGWFWLQLAKAGLVYLKMFLLRAPRPQRFKRLLALYSCVGRIRGYMAARKRSGMDAGQHG